jgi:hypothetical protein
VEVGETVAHPCHGKVPSQVTTVVVLVGQGCFIVGGGIQRALAKLERKVRLSLVAGHLEL